MNGDGSGMKQLTEAQADDGEPAWSPDARRVAFTSTRDGNSEIYVMNSDGGNQTRLTYDAEPDLTPAWLAEGRIGFTSWREGPAAIFVMDDTGANVMRWT